MERLIKITHALYCDAMENMYDTRRDMWIEIKDYLEELKEYKQLEEQGLLLRLPCKVGDTVYEVQEIRKRIQPMQITGIKVNRLGGISFEWEQKDGIGIYQSLNGFTINQLGKRVFLTPEEAEAKLEELRGVSNE